MWWIESGWHGSTPSGRVRRPCPGRLRSNTRNDGSTGCCSRTPRGGGGVRDRISRHRRSLVCGVIRRPGFVGAHRCCVDDQVLTVQVGSEGGPEAAARNARYTALADARRDRPVLLAHTLDDQAETVLLGLGRGSGARSIAGMRPYGVPWCRPLLGVRREVTHAVCAELGLNVWHDPHNTDRRFTRSRLRLEVLPLMEEVLGGGVAEALARTATALRGDTELIDSLIAQAMSAASTPDGLDAEALTALADPVRRGVIRSWLLAGGAIGLTDKQIRGVDTLVTAWRGQGGVAVGSALRNQRLVAGRSGGVLTLHREPV